jgi:hypothetical protein
VSVTTTSLSNGVVGAAYSQTLNASGGTPPYGIWTVSAGTLPPGLTLNASTGVVSGTPTTAVGSPFGFSVTVKDSAGNASPAQSLSIAIATGVSVPTFTISVGAQPQTITDQPGLTLNLSPGYPLPLDAQFALSFVPDAAGLPTNTYMPNGSYRGAALQFASGGTSTSVTIPANSPSWPLPAVQVGDVAGVITVKLTSLSVSGGGPALQMPTSAPFATITVPRLAPVITAGSVRLTNVTTSGFTVEVMASSTPRDLTSATITFAAASGAQLNGSSFTVQLGATATTWFASAPGQAAGGAFDLQIPFPFSGAASAIGSVSVTLTNSVGVSLVSSGGM